MNVYLGIDPGQTGAITTIYPDEVAYIFSIPIIDREIDVTSLTNHMNTLKDYDCITYIETVWKPVSLVRLAGIIEGIFMANNFIIKRVSPSTWRKVVLNNSRASKQDAIDYCKKEFPNTPLFKTYRSRKENHNFAESLCIAEYGRRKQLSL